MKRWLLGTAAMAAMAVSASSAFAGGFEVRSQSAFFTGTAFAGTAAAGSSLSSVLWNPAASSIVKDTPMMDSNYSLILPEVNVRATSVTRPLSATADPADLPGADEVDFGRTGFVPASYFGYRLNDRTVLAVSLNSPFGSSTKPDDMGWDGNFLAQTSKLSSNNLTPSLSYEVVPGLLTVGAGLQVQLFEVKRLRTSLYNGNDAWDVGFGGTAGINITPTRGTSIGLGYRSQVKHELKGDFAVEPVLLLPCWRMRATV